MINLILMLFFGMIFLRKILCMTIIVEEVAANGRKRGREKPKDNVMSAGVSVCMKAYERQSF